MATNIGTLVIEMSANIARLQTDMSEAKSTVDKAMTGISSAVEMAKKAFIGLTGITGVMMFKDMILSVAEAEKSLNELSVTAGVSADKLGGLASIGKLTGTGADTLASAMNKLSKNLSTSTEDSKGAATAIQNLGLNFAEFSALSPDERMLAVARAMANFQDGAGKSAAAMMLFGKSGAELLPYLRDLATVGEVHGKITAQQAEEAKHLDDNLIKLKASSEAWKRQLANDLIPELNRLTTALLENRKESGLFVGTLDTVIGALGRYLGLGKIGIGEVLNKQAMAEAASEVLKTKKAYDDLVATYGNVASSAPWGAKAQAEIDKAQKAFEDAKAKFKAAREAFLKLDSTAGAGRGTAVLNDPVIGRVKTELPSSANPKDAGLNEALTLLNSLRTQYEKLNGEVSIYAETERKIAAIKGGVSDQTKAEILALAKLIDLRTIEKQQSESVIKANEAQIADREALDAAIQQTHASLTQATKDFQIQFAQLGMTSDQIARLTLAQKLEADQMKLGAEVSDKVEKGLISQAEADKLLAAAKDKANVAIAAQNQLLNAQSLQRQDGGHGLDQATQDYADKVRRMGDAYKDLGTKAVGGLEDAFTDFFSKGKADWKSYFQMIYSEVIRLQVVRPMMASLFNPGGLGGAGGLLGSLGNLLGFGSPNSRLAGATGFGDYNAIGALDGARAAGGPVNGGGAYLVGENGPEIMVPQTAGSVIPNSQISGKSYNPTYNISIDARTDRAAVASDVANAIQMSQMRFAEQLRQQGVIA